MNNIKKYFGVSGIPFQKISPDNAFDSTDVTTVDDKLQSLALIGGIAVCTGEPGIGKTYAIETWGRRQQNDAITTIWVDDPGTSVFSLLGRCIQGMGQKPAHGNDMLWRQFYEMFSKLRETKRHLVFIIDESQQLPIEALEQIKRLTNLSREYPPLLSFILIGHSDFLAPFSGQRLRALKRRLLAVISLKGLTSDEIGPYVGHHIAAVGGKKELLCQKAIDQLWNVSRGVPRIINTLALHAVLEAKRQGLDHVDDSIAETITLDDELL